MKTIKEKLWKESKSAKKFPPDWYVISTRDVIEILEEKREGIAKEIFDKIFQLIEQTKSKYPVPLEKSRFYSRLLKLKQEYLQN